jgi:hypothetical protein
MNGGTLGTDDSTVVVAVAPTEAGLVEDTIATGTSIAVIGVDGDCAGGEGVTVTAPMDDGGDDDDDEAEETIVCWAANNSLHRTH